MSNIRRIASITRQVIPNQRRMPLLQRMRSNGQDFNTDYQPSSFNTQLSTAVFRVKVLSGAKRIAGFQLWGCVATP